MTAKKFELTYGTMYNPPIELHEKFDAAIAEARSRLGKEYSMWIGGKDRYAEQKFEDRTPIDTSTVLAVMQKGTAKDAEDAVEAADKAFTGWRRTSWQERVAILRKAADLMDERIFTISAAMALEVGKNRMESLGDVAEAAALVRYNCDQTEKNDGFTVQMGTDPIEGYLSTNKSVLRPYGVWLVISPFNFPAALSFGPASAALVTGNTVVLKPATDTPWVPRLISQCFIDAGIPAGVFNFVTGPGSTLGQALIDSPKVAGITFTGSLPVGMGIYQSFGKGKYVRPVILELGGKNASIITKNANLDDAATGIVRSAFGLQGQKCSANSRILIEESVYDKLVAKLVEKTNALVIGDPTKREVFMGPVVNKSSYQDFQDFCADLAKNGRILTGGKVLTDGDYAKGYFATPTLVADLPLDHPLWKTEMFLPISTVAPIKSLDEGLEIANSSEYGLTAGFYGSEEEAQYFFENIEAGTVYANRAQGATTGAWPGYQPFGGWKGSGSSGKNAGGVYYLQLYMHETSCTLVKKA